MSETWLLFEDVSHDAVQCTLYPLPKDYPRPVDAYIVFEHSGDFTIAAQKAVHAVFDLARKRSIPVQPGVILDFDESNQVVGFEILNVSKRTSPKDLSSMQFESA